MVEQILKMGLNFYHGKKKILKKTLKRACIFIMVKQILKKGLKFYHGKIYSEKGL